MNQNRFYYMNAYQLPYWSRFRGCVILSCVRFFLIFSLNYQQGVTRCCIRIDKWEEITKSSLQTNQKQTYEYIWIWQKFTVSKGWLLHFLNLNNIPNLPQIFVIAEAWLGLTLCSPCFLPARFTRMLANLRNQNKCKPSELITSP